MKQGNAKRPKTFWVIIILAAIIFLAVDLTMIFYDDFWFEKIILPNLDLPVPEDRVYPVMHMDMDDLKLHLFGEMVSENVNVKDNIIYHYVVTKYADKEDEIYKEERGYIKGGKNHITISGKTFSFQGDLSKLNFGSAAGESGIFYNGLEISTNFKAPYVGSKDQIKIVYKCDGPFAKDYDDYYCQTNEIDYVEQYEFSHYTGTGFTTGGEHPPLWYKIYAKRINDVDFIFNGRLSGEYTSDKDWMNCAIWAEHADYYCDGVGKYATKEYLDQLLQDKVNQQKIKEWGEFVESL